GLRIANSSNITLKNIISQNNGTWGIYTSHSNDITIDSAISKDNNAINPTGWNHHGIYISNSAANCVIRNCTVEGNFGNGIHFNGDASQGGAGIVSNALVEKNTITNNGKNGGSAINCDGVQNSTLKNNALKNNHAKGIALYRIDAAEGSKNNIIQNNTVVMSDDARGAALVIKNASTNNTIDSNVISAPAVAVVVSQDSLGGLKSNHNTFAGKFSVDSDETRINFTQWKTATGQDANSTGKDDGNKKKLAAAIAAGVACLFASIFVAVTFIIRRKNLNKWLGAYIKTARQRRAHKGPSELHVLICIADHFEPANGNVPPALADGRVERWCTAYPRLFSQFRDDDGRPPQHTFFYPLEQYNEKHVERIAHLCAQGFGEIELHLHHDNDNSANLRSELQRYKQLIHSKHNCLPRDPRTGQIRYAFVHGNWALDNSRPDRRWCGVNDEIDILIQTGCYADFTLPSAPDATQINKINSIYYAVDDPAKPCSHATGVDITSAPQPPNSLLMIQGPLILDWKRGKIENGCIQGSQPPTMDRLDLWLKANVHVPTRPDWRFIKLHTHGCPEDNSAVILGEAMTRFHQNLVHLSDRNPGFRFHYHYVTAREMYNLAKAAEAGFRGTVNEARNYILPDPRVVAGSKTHPFPPAQQTLNSQNYV
ncbi:MAG TPA: right-handed parallel beta-helix repeat-containing protein, partial [Tepidisphaeraceae bacterium]